MAKQMTITIESDSLLILRGRGSRRAWCPLCAAEGEMIALEETGVISNLERPALEDWLNSDESAGLAKVAGKGITNAANGKTGN